MNQTQNLSRAKALPLLHSYVNKYEPFSKQYIYFYMAYNTDESSWGFVGRNNMYILSPRPHKQALTATEKKQMKEVHDQHSNYIKALRKKPQLKNQRINAYLDNIQTNINAIRKLTTK